MFRDTSKCTLCFSSQRGKDLSAAAIGNVALRIAAIGNDDDLLPQQLQAGVRVATMRSELRGKVAMCLDVSGTLDTSDVHISIPQNRRMYRDGINKRLRQLTEDDNIWGNIWSYEVERVSEMVDLPVLGLQSMLLSARMNSDFVSRRHIHRIHVRGHEQVSSTFVTLEDQMRSEQKVVNAYLAKTGHERDERRRRMPLYQFQSFIRAASTMADRYVWKRQMQKVFDVKHSWGFRQCEHQEAAVAVANEPCDCGAILRGQSERIMYMSNEGVLNAGYDTRDGTKRLYLDSGADASKCSCKRYTACGCYVDVRHAQSLIHRFNRYHLNGYYGDDEEPSRVRWSHFGPGSPHGRLMFSGRMHSPHPEMDGDVVAVCANIDGGTGRRYYVDRVGRVRPTTNKAVMEQNRCDNGFRFHGEPEIPGQRYSYQNHVLRMDYAIHESAMGSCDGASGECLCRERSFKVGFLETYRNPETGTFRVDEDERKESELHCDSNYTRDLSKFDHSHKVRQVGMQTPQVRELLALNSTFLHFYPNTVKAAYHGALCQEAKIMRHYLSVIRDPMTRQHLEAQKTVLTAARLQNFKREHETYEVLFSSEWMDARQLLSAEWMDDDDKGNKIKKTLVTSSGKKNLMSFVMLFRGAQGFLRMLVEHLIQSL